MLNPRKIIALLAMALILTNPAGAVTYKSDIQSLMTRPYPIYFGNQFMDKGINSTNIERIAKDLDILAINKQSDIFAENGSNSALASQLRSYNSNLKVFQYVNLIDVWNATNTYQWLVNNNALLYDDNGQVVHPYEGTYGTQRSAADSTKVIWQDYWANHAASITNSGMDGIFSDNWWRSNAQGWAISATRYTDLQNGWEAIGQKAKSAMGSGKILIGNGPAYGLYQARDITMLEMRNKPNATDFNNYLKWSDQADSFGQANADTIQNKMDASDYMHSYDSILGFSLPACLLTNNIFGFSNDPTVFGLIEKVGKIGYPKYARYRAGGILQRDYTAGKVLFNDSSGSVTVGLPTGVFKDVDGNAVNSVTLASFRGIILKGTPPVTPAAPTGLTASGVYKGSTTGNYYVNLSWTDASDNETGFELYQSINSTTNYQVITRPPANNTKYTVNLGTNPVPGTYYYIVKAVNNGTYSAASNTVGAKVNPPPAAPSNLTVKSITKGATSGIYYVNLNWQDNSTNESNFQIYQSVNSTSNFKLVKTPSAGSQNYAVSIGTNPTPGIYYYKIVAVNSAGSSAPSNTVSTNVGIAPPTGLTVTGASKGSTSGYYYINLSWTDNSNNETGFRIYNSLNSTTNFQVIKTPGANMSSYNVNVGKTPGTYYFKITAFNASGESAPSNVISKTVQ